MTGLLMLGIFVGYVLIAVVIGTVIAKVFYWKDFICDSTDADCFGALCGVLWPASPFILACFGLVKLISRFFD